MAEPRKPFYVSFTHDRIPQWVDHSHSQPGPPGGSANRAGYTSVTSKARLTIAWDAGHSGVNGQIPVFARSVNVYFRLTDFVIAISSDFTRRSCAYQTTLRHELDAHIYDPIRIFHSYRDVLIRRLNTINVPTQQTPLRMAADQVESRQEMLESRIVNAIGQTRRELVRDLRLARDRHDSAESYRLDHNQCTDAEWASGR